MQKTGKGALRLVTALVLSLGLAGSAWAQPMMPGRGGPGLTPEQAGKVFDLKEKFTAGSIKLRRQLTVKHAELEVLQKAEKPDTKAIEAKKKEIEPLINQLRERMQALQQEIKKVAPEAAMGRGMGPHGMGPGPGMGAGPGAPPPPPPPATQPEATPAAPAAPPAK